jgi:UDP-N-acetyl-D-glucosamine/UDP-N-acetyl-D-galactosamine dehydrogenase
VKVNLRNAKIGIIGLGYVGLPLAVEFGKKYCTFGYDISESRISELKRGNDTTLEVASDELLLAKNLNFTTVPGDLKKANVYIVTVPTPIDNSNKPDLGPLVEASKLIASVVAVGDIIIYESTVFPGATEDDCIPVIEQYSGLEYNKDFFAGYSPERINPGDKEHGVTTIMKVTSGSTPDVSVFVDDLYGSIISAGTFKAGSIRVAEAAKVIENTQRDLNIALINELAIIFNKLDIDTQEVLEAAGTKWNFVPFRPGLVGGHCIGVDPFYLTHKAQSIGYHPEIILAGRRMNDGMASYVTGVMVKTMLKKRIHIEGSRILVMGLTFKENCPDVRNTKVVDIINELEEYGAVVDVFDPWVSPEQTQKTYGILPITDLDSAKYDGIILAVAHYQFLSMGVDAIRALGKSSHILYDLKCVFSKAEVDLRL